MANNFNFKNCLIGANNIVKNSDKKRWVYSGYRGYSGNVFARNEIMFGVDNDSLSHAYNCKNKAKVQLMVLMKVLA